MEQDLIEFLNDELEGAWVCGSQNTAPPSKFKEAVINPSRNQVILTTETGTEYVFTLKSVFK